MVISPPLLWMIAGILLCVLEVVLPTEFVEFAIGISAILTGFLALIVPWFTVQVMLWLVLSGISVWLIQRWSRRQRSARLDATEGRTLTPIPAGETGRVLYEGNSWQARCEIEGSAIDPEQEVYVVRQEGTTLIVVPKLFLKEL